MRGRAAAAGRKRAVRRAGTFRLAPAVALAALAALAIAALARAPPTAPYPHPCRAASTPSSPTWTVPARPVPRWPSSRTAR